MKIKPTGIKRNASLLHDQDGACTELINFRFKDEEWQSIQPGTLSYNANNTGSAGIWFSHSVSPDNRLILWDSADNGLYDVTLATGTATDDTKLLIKSISGAEKIVSFGVLIVVMTFDNRYYFKYSQSTNSYSELDQIQHGRYLFSDTNRELFGKTFVPSTTANYASEGLSHLLERKRALEEIGKINAHVFFRVAFRTFDGNFVLYSPISYRHIGYKEDNSDNPVANIRENSGSTAFNYDWGSWGQPVYSLNFTTEQFNIIKNYKNIIKSICIFMTSPRYDFLIPDSDAGFITDTDASYNYNILPQAKDPITSFKEDANFYLVDEIMIDSVNGVSFSETFVAQTEASGGATLAHTNIKPGSEVVTSGATTYVKGVDYDINYTTALIYIVAGMLTRDTFIASYTPITLPNKNITAGSFSIHSLVYGTDYTVDYVNGILYILSGGAAVVGEEYLYSYSAASSSTMVAGNTYSITYETNIGDTIKLGDVSTIQTNEFLPVDNYTHHKYFSNVCLEYNSRLHLGNIKTRLGDVQNLTVFDNTSQDHVYAGYTPVQDQNNKSWIMFALVTIETEKDDKYILTSFNDVAIFLGINDFSALNPILYYPDERARKITIIGADTTGYYSLLEVNLTVSTWGNYSYYIDPTLVFSNPMTLGSGTYHTRVLKYKMLLLPTALSGTAITVNQDRTVYDTNRVQVSELNNPLLFPAANSYQIGRSEGTVVGLASQSIPVSVGQFGQYPVYVFTNEGIWALEQGSTVLYQSIQPVSLLEANNINSIIPIDGGILFGTAKGLFILSGSNIKEISIPVRGLPEQFINSLASFTTTQTNLPATLSTTDFVSWMSGAVFGYDKINKEIIISKDQTYIFSLESGLWYKQSSIFSNFLRIAGKFYGMIGYALYDLETPDNATDVTAYVITRPIKFGTDGLKSISKTILRLIADMTSKSVNKLSFHLYGSLNGFEWKLIQGKDETDFINSTSGPGKEIALNFTRTTSRYFIFMLALKSKVIRLAGIDIDVEPKYNNKER